MSYTEYYTTDIDHFEILKGFKKFKELLCYESLPAIGLGILRPNPYRILSLQPNTTKARFNSLVNPRSSALNKAN